MVVSCYKRRETILEKIERKVASIHKNSRHISTDGKACTSSVYIEKEEPLEIVATNLLYYSVQLIAP